MKDTEDTLCPNCGRKPLFSCREGFCKGAPSLEQTKATDADLEREISSVELAEFIREEWCYERTGDPQDEAVNQILARLCRRFELREPTDG